MEEKRRLPSWMFNKVGKPVDVDENDVISKEKVSKVTESIKPKAKRVIRKKNNNDDKSFLVKCETKRKRRGVVEKDVIECRDHEEEVVVVEKRKRGMVGRKVDDQSLRKKKRKEDTYENGNENQASSRDEEEDDLTMEDLLSIAKEVTLFNIILLYMFTARFRVCVDLTFGAEYCAIVTCSRDNHPYQRVT